MIDRIYLALAGCLGGTGFNVAVNRIAGSLGNGAWPLPGEKKE